MKTTNKFFALVLMAVAMVFASCGKDDDTPVDYSKAILGKWKSMTEDGVSTPTNLRKIMTLTSDCLYASTALVTPAGEVFWKNQILYSYQLDGASFSFSDAEGGYNINGTIAGIENDQLEFAPYVLQRADGAATITITKMLFQKVTADYSQDIIGMWEGVEMTGYETYGDYHHRIEYRADGTYTYYSWDESTQTWKPLEDVFDEWNVDGDWLATRWQNKGSDVMNYEWWDVDYIKDGTMKWSALREKENGERFTTTFTWKKVK